MQQLNVHDYYDLGKKIADLESKINAAGFNTLAKSSIAWPLYLLRWSFKSLLKEPCALLPASQRSAKKIIKQLDNLVPDDVQEIFAFEKSDIFQHYELSGLAATFKDFETVLKNDMPEMSTFAVAQIGILRTDDLINSAYRQINETLQSELEKKAKDDIIEAGKCLAFRVSTASAFHACRAIETGIDQYYAALTGKPYAVSANGGNNNWGAKIIALEKEKADSKVTEFLTHIRKQYRNPVAHPEVVVDEHEAVDLFIASLSAISMMLGATKQALASQDGQQKATHTTSTKKIAATK